MLTKICGLARALYILLAVVAGFVALGTMDVMLVIIVLGLISGITMPQERIVMAGVAVVSLPIIGTALGHIPAIGAQLTAVTGNLQMGVAGALASATAIFLYGLVMDGLMGMVGGGATHAKAAHAG